MRNIFLEKSYPKCVGEGAPDTFMKNHCLLDFGRWIFIMLYSIKGAVTDLRYYVRSKFSRSLVHWKDLTLIWEVVFKLGYVFCQER